MLERPYEDLVTEELIDSLPGPKIEDLEPESVPHKVKVEGVSMETISTDPAQMDVESGSMEPVSTKDEPVEDAEMEEAHGQGPAPSKKPRTSSDPAAASSKERGSMEPESFEDLGGDSDVFKNLPKISDEDVQEALKKQGVWGDQSTHIDPQDIDMARKASSAPDASKASEINDEFVTTSKRESEELDLKKLVEYKTFLAENQPIEHSSPILALANQKHGQATGFYHDNGRNDPVYWFKLHDMIFRDPKTPFEHPTQKYGCNEKTLGNCMKRLDPVYDNRVPKGKIN